jgi:ABC-2 type transport system permease protein
VNYWAVFRAVVGKSLVEMKRYLFNTVSGLVTMYIVFLLLFFGARSLNLPFSTGSGLEGLVVGYLVWMMSIIAYQDLAYTIANEAEVGTLEQLFLSPTGFAWVGGSYMIGSFLTNLGMSSLVLLSMMLTSGQWLHLDILSLLPLIPITLAAAYGLGFILAGLAVVFKRIQALFQILTFGLVAFVAAPIAKYAWMKFLPLAMGNQLLRKVMVDGLRVWELPAQDLLVATGVGLGYLLFGLLVFNYCLKVARDRGMLGHY